MFDGSISGQVYNRLDNLDGIEDRIIIYLLSYYNKTPREKAQVDVIRKILFNDDINALDMPVPSNEEIAQLISNDNLEQSGKRIFRSPRLEDPKVMEGTILKVYVDSIIPDNHLMSTINIGIDIVVNDKIINLKVPQPDSEEDLEDMDDEAREEYENEQKLKSCNEIGENGATQADVNESSGATNLYVMALEDGKIVQVQYKSRVTALTKAVISLLNGADVQGVGKITFSRKNSIFNQAQYGIWNHRNCEGMKIVMGVKMSGVS